MDDSWIEKGADGYWRVKGVSGGFPFQSKPHRFWIAAALDWLFS